jgi:hypothetical protein
MISSKKLFKVLWVSIGVLVLLWLSLPGKAFFEHYFDLHIRYLPGFPFFMTGIIASPFGREFFGIIFVPLIIIFSFFPTILFFLGSLIVNKKLFMLFYVCFITLIMLLDIYCFISGWSYGFRYQGKDFLYQSLAKNSVSFLAIYLLLGAYFVKRHSVFLHISLLIFCVTISTIAFPWLGESI